VTATQAPDRRCTEPPVSALLTAYCFGDADHVTCERVQEHLLACPVCWDEVLRLEATVEVLRRDPHISPQPVTAEAVALVTIDGHGEHRFAGHVGFAVLSSGLYAALNAASVWTELAYQFARFEHLALWLVPATFASMFVGMLAVMWLGVRFERGARPMGLVASLLAFSLLTVISLVVTVALLPHEQVVHATFSTRAAGAAHVKSVLSYFVILAVLYVLVPWQAIIGLERELVQGRVGNTLALLRHDADAFHPTGVWYLRPSVLGWLFAFNVPFSIVGGNYLLDHLVPGPYSSWFAVALYIRMALWFVVAGAGLGWYVRRLQDVKRLALLMTKLSAQP
jgi:hypothetical protein